MHVIALANEKGGVAKSATCINLACHAAQLGAPAMVIDMDPQQSTMKWGERRDGGANPNVVTARPTDLEGLIKKYRKAGVAWCFLDLPGRSASVLSIGVKMAHFVLITSRPHPVDLEGTHDVVRACHNLKRKYAFLMNIAPPPANNPRTKAVMAALREAGHDVCDVVVYQRAAVPDAIAAGKGVSEYQPKGPSAAEYAQLFNWLDERL